VGWGTKRKGLVLENLVEKSPESRNLWLFLIERESKRMKTELFLESDLSMSSVEFVKDCWLDKFWLFVRCFCRSLTSSRTR
jgi:hypothetical protein